ncbi:unnamed protein product [Paramecium primaurelia]|uniref:Uncharacterized protein n=1 Tax=Paramecium primaurelia TaxID=5886 RepID=A0A8S1QFA3_PARPR|nr:unnamed protein product [Paramecium primaurelia]
MQYPEFKQYSGISYIYLNLINNINFYTQRIQNQRIRYYQKEQEKSAGQQICLMKFQEYNLFSRINLEN